MLINSSIFWATFDCVLCCFQDGDSALATAPQVEQPPSENWTSGEGTSNELELPADTAVVEAEGHEKENDMVSKTESD